MNTNLFFRTTFAICLVSFVAVLFPQFGFGHTDGSGNPLPHATVRVWDTRPLLGADPDDSVHDIGGLTIDVATAANPLTIATAWENTTCPGGPCGAMLWNPATDDFHCWGVTGGFTASVDLNTSAPVLTDGAGRTYGPGDVWVGGPNGAPLYVKFKSAAFHPVAGSARIYFPVGSVWDVLVDQGTGEVWVSQPSVGGISRIDPITGAQTRWLVGGQPRELAQDSSGQIYATAGSAGIIRLNPATDAVRKWAVAGLLASGGSPFATPDGIHIDSGGDVWFTESVSSEIGRLNPTTDVITEYTKSGLSNPQLIATSGSGAKLQAFFTEGSGNSVSVVTDVEAVGTATAVTPADSVVTPTTHGTSPRDRALSFRNVTITPVVHIIDGVDGGPDALGTTKTSAGERIPGLLRFPLSPTIPGSGFPGLHFPSGMTGVALPNTIFGAFLGSDRVFEASSLAIIAEPDPDPSVRLTKTLTSGPDVADDPRGPSPIAPPESITFETLNTQCSGVQGTFEWFLNGTSLGSALSDPARTCTCAAPIDTFVASNTALIASAWNSSGINDFRFTATGPSGAHISWTRANFTANSSAQTFCVFDNGGGNCDVLSLCDAGHDPHAVDQTTTVVVADPATLPDGEIDVVVEIEQLVTTAYDFELTYSNATGPDDVLVVDTVPAEWDVTQVGAAVVTGGSSGGPQPDGNGGTGTVDVFNAGKGNPSKSATKINWLPDTASLSTIRVDATTRPSPGKKNVKFAPTSCGALYLNEDGAAAFELDPTTGEPLRDPVTGEKLPAILESEGICLAAVFDVNGDSIIVRDGSGDEDGDGLTDLAESCDIGIDPCVADSDFDGLSDSAELALGTNPLLLDTDGDGLSDGHIPPPGLSHKFCETFFGSDPLDSDTDDDGMSDGDEVTVGTDPLNPDTDGDGVPDGSDACPLSVPLTDLDQDGCED